MSHTINQIDTNERILSFMGDVLSLINGKKQKNYFQCYRLKLYSDSVIKIQQIRLVYKKPLLHFNPLSEQLIIPHIVHNQGLSRRFTEEAYPDYNMHSAHGRRNFRETYVCNIYAKMTESRINYPMVMFYNNCPTIYLNLEASNNNYIALRNNLQRYKDIIGQRQHLTSVQLKIYSRILFLLMFASPYTERAAYYTAIQDLISYYKGKYPNLKIFSHPIDEVINEILNHNMDFLPQF